LVEELPNLADDGLETPEVGDWAEQKYQLVRTYAGLFARGTRKKWKNRVFVDLFAGAGRARLKGSRRIVTSSSFLALGVDVPFDRYIFCDELPANLDALRARVAREYPKTDVRFIDGDVNAKVSDVIAALPAHRPGEGVLSVCFVDPFNFGDFRFATIRALAARYMDFLVLIPAGYDGNRNRDIYLDGTSEKLDQFLGDGEWRAEWDRLTRHGPQRFSSFVIGQFGARMKSLDFRYESLGDAVPIKIPGMGVMLYVLILFSRDPLGKKFWKATQNACDPQQGLGLEF
jgi:three-Cys-motif partner protein